jgi:hypothetical protein
MRNVSDKTVENIKAQILCSVIFFSKNGAIYEAMWKNIVEPGRPKVTLRLMHIVFWITKATNTAASVV